MCYEVSCHRFLYDYFQEHQEDTRVTIRKINIVRRNVEQELKLKLRIDITRDSLSAVVNNTNGCLVLENISAWAGKSRVEDNIVVGRICKCCLCGRIWYDGNFNCFTIKFCECFCACAEW